jgi:hypothetical protein
MSEPEYESPAVALWHSLLGPLPPDAVPIRKPVAPPGMIPDPEVSPVAAWEQLILHLSAGNAGSRTIQVVLDGSGTLLSAGDGVLYRSGLQNPAPPPVNEPALIQQESLGGRFEPDGSFHGTRWRSVAIDRGEEELDWEMARSEPSIDDVSGLRAVVEEVIRRQSPKSP